MPNDDRYYQNMAVAHTSMAQVDKELITQKLVVKTEFQPEVSPRQMDSIALPTSRVSESQSPYDKKLNVSISDQRLDIKMAPVIAVNTDLSYLFEQERAQHAATKQPRSKNFIEKNKKLHRSQMRGRFDTTTSVASVLNLEPAEEKPVEASKQVHHHSRA